MITALLTTALASEPTPFFRHAIGATDLEAGHARASLSTGLAAWDPTSVGDSVGLEVSPAKGLVLFGNGFGTATFKRDTVNATGMAGARFDLYRNDHVAVAAFGGLRYGAVLGSWEDDPAWRLSGGLALHVAPGDIWAMDVTTNLLSVPLFDEDAPTQTAVDLFWHTQIVQSWQLTETSQLRVGIEPLPYVAIRKRIAKRVWVEPAVGALMTAVKLEAVL